MRASIYLPGIIFLSFSFPLSLRQDPLQASIERGKKVYGTTCLACHQSKGSGVSGMNPPLIGTPYVLGEKDTLINIVLNGFDRELELNGKHYNNPMPAQAQLKDAEIADVLTYVRNSFGNKASGVTAADVKKLRGK